MAARVSGKGASHGRSGVGGDGGSDGGADLAADDAGADRAKDSASTASPKGPKTVPTDQAIDDFLAGLESEQQRDDSAELVALMRRVSGEQPMMWGSSIVGFGTKRYRYANGREGDWMRIGFAPRRGKFALYITGDAASHTDELAAMGKTKIGKGCIYLNKLADVDVDQLEALVRRCYAEGEGC